MGALVNKVIWWFLMGFFITLFSQTADDELYNGHPPLAGETIMLNNTMTMIVLVDHLQGWEKRFVNPVEKDSGRTVKQEQATTYKPLF